jgi:hypothetical protein
MKIDKNWKIRVCKGCVGTEAVIQTVALERGQLTVKEVKELPHTIQTQAGNRIWVRE